MNDPLLTSPAACGCCAEPAELNRSTPVDVFNPPGLPAVARRVGTAGTFAATMRAALTRELERLRTRGSDDSAVALVDTWAVVLDVLTFYSERISGEGYLRTATEVDSLAELAGSVGYRRSPGRAAAAWVALTLEDAPGTPRKVPIARRTRVASLPGPGETPKTYETIQELTARPAWNAMRARTTMPAAPTAGTTEIHVAGAATDLAAGDVIFVTGRERDASAGSEAWAVRTISAVTRMGDVAVNRGVTRLGWVEPLGAGRGGAETAPDPRDVRVFVLRRRAGIFGTNAPDWRSMPAELRQEYLDPPPGFGHAVKHGFEHPVEHAVEHAVAHAVGGSGPHVAAPTAGSPLPDQWPRFSVVPHGAPDNTVDLDTVYPAVAAGSWVVLTRPGVAQAYRVTSSTETARADFTLTGKVTRLTLDGPGVAGHFGDHVRATTVLARSEALPLAEAPTMMPVQGDEIVLAEAVPALDPGRPVIVSGRRPLLRVAEDVRSLALLPDGGGTPVPLHPGDLLTVRAPATDNDDGSRTWPVVADPGTGTGPLAGTVAGTVVAAPGTVQPQTAPEDAETISELSFVAEAADQPATITTLRLAAALTGCYDRASLVVYANVASATHGETREEVLGSGDATASFQRFTLAQGPLTQVPAKRGAGTESTLEVWVDGRAWTEVASLSGVASADQVFVTHSDDDGRVTVVFGDGVSGARLPTGTNNVTARYRVGLGLAGRVEAGRLTLPMTRPLGLRSTTNPLPAGLAADPEPPDAIREGAALVTRTFDRVVSLTDVRDFAAAFSGIGKAQARWVWQGGTRIVHLTVAGDAGQQLDEQARADLLAALRVAGDPLLPLRVDEAELVEFDLAARVVVDSRSEPGTVRAGAAETLRSVFGFEERALGQSVTASEIAAAGHAVSGVIALTVTALHVGSPAVRHAVLPARAAYGDGTTVHPAQLLTLRPAGLLLTEVPG